MCLEENKPIFAEQTMIMLTKKEKEIYQYIRNALMTHGQAPSLGEIGQAVKQSSKGTTYRYLKQLEAKGYIELVEGKRNIRLLKEAPVLEIPVLGQIAAGDPIENFDSPEALNIQSLFCDPARFLLRVKGDSMSGDNILDGDYIICEKRPLESLHAEDILVVEIERQEVALKRLKAVDSEHVSLISSNPAYPSRQYPNDSVSVRGVFCGLLRV